MSQALYRQIHTSLLDYLSGHQTLEGFRDWFDRYTWGIYESLEGTTSAELAAEIELRLAEFSSGHWSEAELQRQLKPLLRIFVDSRQSWGWLEAECRTASSNDIICPMTPVDQIAFPGSIVDIRSSKVFA